MSTASRIKALERRRGTTSEEERQARFLNDLLKRPLPTEVEPVPEFAEAAARREAP